jgi:hypothetical protein
MNGIRGFTSAWVQRAKRIPLPDARHGLSVAAVNKKEIPMLRTFTAALLAATLIAGPSLAAQPSDNNSSAPAAAQTANPHVKHANAVKSAKSGKLARHGRKHTRMHIVRWSKAHRHHAAHHAKFGKGKHVRGGAHTAKLPAAQNANR